jgi:4-hydroxybutyrate dehydrogenase
MNMLHQPALTSELFLPRTLFGDGSISSLASEMNSLHLKRPLLVTDQGIVAAGLAARTVAACGSHARVVLFDSVTENPLFADVDNGAAVYAREQCDSVIALGGGSVIDTAKVIALLATHRGQVADYMGPRGATHGAGAFIQTVPRHRSASVHGIWCPASRFSIRA